MNKLGYLFKPKKNMAKPNTKEIKVGKYTLTKHAQNRIAEPKRDVTKHNVLRNLFGRSEVTRLYDYRGELQYDRIHKKAKIVTHISPKHRVKTIHKVHKPLKETVEELFQSRANPHDLRFHNLRYIEKVADNIGSLTRENFRSAESTNDVSTTVYSIADLFAFVKQYDKKFSPTLYNKNTPLERGV